MVSFFPPLVFYVQNNNVKQNSLNVQALTFFQK